MERGAWQGALCRTAPHAYAAARAPVKSCSHPPPSEPQHPPHTWSAHMPHLLPEERLASSARHSRMRCLLCIFGAHQYTQPRTCCLNSALPAAPGITRSLCTTPRT